MDIRRPRTVAQRHGDFAAAREFENLVGKWLGPYKVENLDAVDRMDFWIPGVFLDVKEKRQPLSGMWPLPAGAKPVDCFVLDELSIRRAMLHVPHAYFLLRDVPGGDRFFLARVDEVLMADRRRVDRIGTTGKRKGKWVVNLLQFRQLADPETELYPAILADQIALPWKRSECLVPEEEA